MPRRGLCLDDEIYGSADIRRRFRVDDETVRSGIQERLEQPLGPLDHEVNRDGHLDDGSHACDEVRSEGDVRHEVAIHHVGVDHPSAGLDRTLRLRRGATQVTPQDRGRDLHRGASADTV